MCGILSMWLLIGMDVSLTATWRAKGQSSTLKDRQTDRLWKRNKNFPQTWNVKLPRRHFKASFKPNTTDLRRRKTESDKFLADTWLHTRVRLPPKNCFDAKETPKTWQQGEFRVFPRSTTQQLLERFLTQVLSRNNSCPFLTVWNSLEFQIRLLCTKLANCWLANWLTG